MSKKKDEILFGANKKGRHVSIASNIFKVCLPFVWLLYPFRFYGKRKVKDGACIYLFNHYRIWDMVYPCYTTSEGVHFIAKKELFHTWLAPFCRASGMIGLDRNGEDVKGLMNILKCLKNAEKIAIAPEGTRNKTNAEMLPFHTGAAMLAIKTKTPIVPIMIYKKPMPFRLNHVLIGEPFELSEYYGKKTDRETLEEATHKLEEIMLDMRRAHTEYLTKKRKKEGNKQNADRNG